jgi:hypothetical protein
LQPATHPVIEFVLSNEDVAGSSARWGHEFYPEGYSFPEWGRENPGDEMEMTGGMDDYVIISNPNITWYSALGKGTGPSSMSIDLTLALEVEVVQRVSSVGEPELTPAAAVGGPPTGNL